jgi:hypothetical protein
MKNFIVKSLLICAVFCSVFVLCAADAPSKFKEFESVTVSAKDFKRVSAFAKLGLASVADADAVDGKAVALIKHPKGKDLHSAKDFKMGVYCEVTKKTLASRIIAKSSLPQDEKYHFYRIGKISASKKITVFAHNSWAMQQSFTQFGSAADPRENSLEVYVSIKFTGKAYVKNSAKENGVFIDKIVFVKSAMPTRKAADSPLPEILQGREILELNADEFSNLKKFASKGVKIVNDADSCCGKAVTLGSGASHKDAFQLGVYSNKSKKRLAFKPFTAGDAAKDEKYHLISVGKVTLEADTMVWAHRSWLIQQKLPRFVAADPAKNSGEIFVSVKLTGPAYVKGSTSENAVFIDRIIFAR